MTIAYIDADILCHQAIHASTTEWDDGDTVSEKGIMDVIRDGVANWSEPIKATTVVPVLSDYHHNWRYALKGPYKLNRSGGGKPSHKEHMKFARAFIRDTWRNTLQIEGLEADDTIGIMVTDPDHAKRSVAVSIDKDFLTLPGRVWNPRSGAKRPMRINAAMADRMWMTQALSGDSVDNYKGIPGIGPKKAEKILEGRVDVWDMWEAVVKAYTDAGLPGKEALLNTRYARILRHNDWDPDKRAVRLFTGNPKKEQWMVIDTKKTARPEVNDG